MDMTIQALAIALALLYPLYRLVGRDRGRSRIALFVALWTVAALNVFDLLALEFPQEFLEYKRYAHVAEGLLCPAWILFSLSYYRRFSPGDVSITQRIILGLSFVPFVMALFFPTQSFFYSPDFALDNMLFLEPVAFFFYLQIMLFLAVALFNLEATVTNAPHGAKWKIKFAMVGSGTIVAAHILYFSQSLLFRAVDMGFGTARSLGVVIGVLMIAYSELSRGFDERIVISRRLAYRSFVVLFCAIFLLGIGLLGEGMKLFGDDFNTYAFFVVAFFACVGLVVLSLSENLRRKVRLAIQRNFYGEKYDYRIEWKKFTDRVTSSRSRDELYRNILTVYCETFGVVGASVFMQGRHNTDFIPLHFHEMDESEFSIPEESELIWLLKGKKQIIDMRAGKFSFNEETDAFLQSREVRFILPLFTGSGLLGLILLGPPINPVEIYDEEDRELMESIARQSAAVIMNLRLGDELAEARDMEGFGKVAAFVLHDLKNQVYPLSLLVENAREYINEPEFQKDMLDSLSNIVGRMNVLIAQLTNIPGKGELKLKPVDLMELAKETAKLIPDARIEFEGGGVKARVDSEEIRKVTLNLFMNAMEAGGGKPFKVIVEEDEDGPRLKVVDFGGGIDPQLLKDGLFLPFRTTKRKGMGIGLYQSKQIVEAHGGAILATSVEGEGATFSVNFPGIPVTE